MLQRLTNAHNKIAVDMESVENMEMVICVNVTMVTMAQTVKRVSSLNCHIHFSLEIKNEFP